MEQSYVGEILVRRGALEPAKLAEALATAEERGVDLRTILLATRAVDEAKLVRALADEVGMPFLEKVSVDRVPESLVEAVPINFARQHHVLPIGESDGVVHAAVGDRAEALRVFAKCRELLRDELGVGPSPQTEAVYLEILRAE